MTPSSFVDRTLAACQPHRRAGIAGFTIMEVTLAIAVLTVGMFSVIGTIANQNSMRRATDELRAARMAGDFVAGAIHSANWDALNDQTDTDTYLTWARHPDPGADGFENDTNCLSDDPAISANLLPYRTRLQGLRVYVEYYRAITAVDSFGGTMLDSGNGNLPCTGGLLDGLLEPTVSGGVTTWTLDPTTQADRPVPACTGTMITERSAGRNRLNGITINNAYAPIRLPATESVAAQVNVRMNERDPVAVRITVSWFDNSRGAPPAGAEPYRMQHTIITGKKR